MKKKKIDFETGLDELIESARKTSEPELRLTAGELHTHIGDYPTTPGRHHAMATASIVLKEAVERYGGRIIYEPPKGKGARVEVVLHLSR